MIQYIYFVKCPDCEDEQFDFFDDAKDYALGHLSQKPVITQIEVNRNDFGECEDSCDLGTIWSWEDMMNETDDEPAISIFTKDDLAGDYDPDTDPEFAALDNSLNQVPDNFRRPVPDGMTIKDLVEEMEENEDMVECTWCEDLFDKSECRREVDLGWLCGRCEAAIKSRGETLTFREGNYWDFLDENLDPNETIELDYDKITTTIITDVRPATYHDPEDWNEREVTDRFTYEVPVEDVATAIWENFITDEDVVDVEGGLSVLEDEAAWQKYLETHLDGLVQKYYKDLLSYFEDDAEEAARKAWQKDYDEYEPDYDNYFDEF